MSTFFHLPPRNRYASSPAGEMTELLGQHFDRHRPWGTHGSEFRISDDERARQVYIPARADDILARQASERHRAKVIHQQLSEVPISLD